MNPRLAYLLTLLLGLLAAWPCARADDPLGGQLGSFQQSQGGRKKLAETESRFRKVLAKYSARTAADDWAADPDVAELIRDRFPGVYLATQRLLIEKDPRVCAMLLHIIDGAAWRGAAPYVTSALAQAQSLELRARLYRTLSRLGGGAALKALEQPLAARAGSETDEVIAICCSGVADMTARRDEKTRRQYAALLKPWMEKLKEPTARTEVASALLRLGDASEARLLLDVMASPDAGQEHRIRVIGLFRDQFHEPAIAVLARVCGDEDATVAEEALESLAAMTTFSGPEPAQPAAPAGKEPAPEAAGAAKSPAPEPSDPDRRKAKAQTILAWWEKNGAHIREDVGKRAVRQEWTAPTTEPKEETQEAVEKGGASWKAETQP